MSPRRLLVVASAIGLYVCAAFLAVHLSADSDGTVLESPQVKTATEEAQLEEQITSVEADLDQANPNAVLLEGSSAAKGPTLYTGCGYKGISKVKSKGTADIRKAGFGNDSISAVKVPAGFCLTLFEAYNKEGAFLKIRGPTNIACLKGRKMVKNKEGRKNWDNQTSSFSITRCAGLTAKQVKLRAAVHQVEKKNKATAPSKGTPKLLTTKVLAPSVKVPTFYTECQYRGSSKPRTKGTPFIVKAGMANNAVSSLVVPHGYCVTLYSEYSRKGKFLKIHGPKNVPCLKSWPMHAGGKSWDDQASSLHITKCKGLTPSQVTSRATNAAKKAIVKATKKGAGLSASAAAAYNKVDNKVNRVVSGAVANAGVQGGTTIFSKKAFKKTAFAKRSNIPKTDKKLGVDDWKLGVSAKDKAKIARLTKTARAKVKMLKVVSKAALYKSRKAKAFEHWDDRSDTGKTKANSNGCNRTDGCRKDLAPKRKSVTAGDAYSGVSGHYYLGRRRRRIGAGFGRRRRTRTKKKAHKIVPTPVASIEKLDSTPRRNSKKRKSALARAISTKTHTAFEWMRTGTFTCPLGMAVLTKAECQKAFNKVKASAGISNKRPLQVGPWQGVPHGCSIQVGLHGDAYYHDYSAHWNTKANTNNARAKTGEFRIICKKAGSVKHKRKAAMAEEETLLQAGVDPLLFGDMPAEAAPKQSPGGAEDRFALQERLMNEKTNLMEVLY